MKIVSVKFIKGLVGHDKLLVDGKPQIAFIGRSNVGKSSLINAISKSTVSRTSSFPGRTQEINLFLVNDLFYLVDLPGYGYARIKSGGREKITDLIAMYLFDKKYSQKKVVLIIDSNVGMTDKDMGMYEELVHYKKDFIIAMSKIDRLSQSERHKKVTEVRNLVGEYPIIAFSSKTKAGLGDLIDEVFGK